MSFDLNLPSGTGGSPDVRDGFVYRVGGKGDNGEATV